MPGRKSTTLALPYLLCTPCFGEHIAKSGELAVASRFMRSQSMEQSALVRFATVLLLYTGQGIPIGLFDFVVPAWLAANGASAADLGFVVAMTGAPWSLKFIAGFIMDRYTFLPMGRRRSWIIGAQVVMIACLVIFAIVSPTPDQILIIGFAALIVNTATVFQDVAADGLTVDILLEDERAIGGSLGSGGYSLGVAAAAALAGALVYAFGIGAAYLVGALLLGCVTIYMIFTLEREGERRMPWSAGSASPVSQSFSVGAWWPLVKETLQNTVKPLHLVWLFFLVIRGLTYGFLIIIVPLVATQYGNWDQTQLNNFNATSQMIGAVVAITIGGILVRWIGSQRSIILFKILMISGLVALAMLTESWSDSRILIVLFIIANLLDTMIAIGSTVFNMRFSPPRIAATQFSIFMALKNQGITLAGILVASFAFLSEPLGMIWFLIGCLSVGLLIVLIVSFPRRQVGTVPAGHETTS